VPQCTFTASFGALGLSPVISPSFRNRTGAIRVRLWEFAISRFALTTWASGLGLDGLANPDWFSLALYPLGTVCRVVRLDLPDGQTGWTIGHKDGTSL